MATFGEIRYRLNKEYPGTDLDVISGIINDRYVDILDTVPWSRLDAEFILQTAAPYNQGIVAVQNGQIAVTLSGGAFDPGVNGFTFRADGRTEPYAFTRIDDTHGTLDRPYEGADNPQAGYCLSRSIYALPPNCRIVRSIRNLSIPVPIERRDRAQADVTDTARTHIGAPRYWNEYMDQPVSTDTGSQIGQAQFGGAVGFVQQMGAEIWPSPDRVYSLQISYTAEVAAFAAKDTSVPFLVWARPNLIMAGCRADLCGLAKDYAGKAIFEAQYQQLLAKMVNDESRRMGPAQMTMQGAYSRHRQQRWNGAFSGKMFGGMSGVPVSSSSSNPYGSPTFVDGETPAGVIDSTNAVFTLAHTPSGGIDLFSNGLYQTLGVDYTLSGNAITFVSGAIPQAGENWILKANYRYIA